MTKKIGLLNFIIISMYNQKFEILLILHKNLYISILLNICFYELFDLFEFIVK